MISVKGSLALLVLAAAALGIGLSLAALLRRPARDPAPPGPPPRLSALAGWSFFFGLLTAAVILASLVTSAYVDFADVADTSPWDHEDLRLATFVLHLVALGPGLAALAFSIAALGAFRESGEALRGRALARMGFLMSLLAGAVLL